MKQTNFHIDRSVLLFFLVMILISGSVFGYRFYNYTPCGVVDFEAVGNEYRVGEIIRFKDKSTQVSNREWSFGDNSEVDKRVTPFHTFKKPGKYQISLKINNRCIKTKTIVVKEKLFILDSTKLANFNIPSSIRVGKLLKVDEFTKDATSWEWRFGETAEVNSKLKEPNYIYNSPGLKTVTLIVNGDPRYSTSKRINVLPELEQNTQPRIVAPRRRTEINLIPTTDPDPIVGIDLPEEPQEDTESDTPPPFRAPDIGNTALSTLFQSIGKKTGSIADLDNYTCENRNIPISARGDSFTLKEWCKVLEKRGKKWKITIQKVSRAENNCITGITLTYKRLSLF
ncbi:PKD domain-containing protein [Spongiivirga sp. MCCC 1A20706]|uniref:PKD domain-containing protein n=1 Tax=Spongiivirga sp. MCCC 1A20706 TaxID=3160963 RepID=UPI0039776D75